ncbi:MAG: DUF47 family protein [bacterium]|nr:DUF47 family protein [bacterium]
MIFGSRQHAVEGLIASYVEHAQASVSCFVEGMEVWLGGAEPVADIVHGVAAAESRADDARRELCLLLYGKALFPESRGDILGLVEAVDKVPNRAEAIMRRIVSQHIGPPAPDLGEGFRALVASVEACTTAMFEGVNVLFKDHHAAVELSNRVDHLESEADRAEMELTERIFTSALEGFPKILYRDLVMDVGGLADRAEDASDRIRIIAIKRET